jgi:ADP-heptose:LPS heptosyltransferase/SAM-dependent methyltransferase
MIPPAAARILVCLRYGIGDLVMELSALEALRRSRPRARLSALGAAPATELLEGTSWFDDVVRSQDFGLTQWEDSGSPAEVAAVRSWLLAGRFDLVLDPTHAVRAVRNAVRELAMPALDVDADIQAAFLRASGRGWDAVRSSTSSRWGIEIPGAPPCLPLEPEERQWASEFLDELPGPALLGVSPAASSPLKQWPLERFGALADEHIERSGGGVLIFAGPQADAASRLRSSMRRAGRARIIGPIHLRRVAALLEACDVFAGNDTGLMHIAAAVGTPVLAMFGPTSPETYLPPGRAVAVIGPDCPRRQRRFGPAECVAAGRCLLRPSGCIADVTAAQARRGLAILGSPPAEAETGTGAGRIRIVGPAAPPNRVLDLEELERPEFAQVLGRMDELLALESRLYLHPSKRWEYPWALDASAATPRSAVLDVGCGGSVFPVYLADRGFDVTAADRSLPPGLGRGGGRGVKYVRADIAALPFPAESFGTVFCLSVIEHLGESGVAGAMGELHRVLKPRGRLLLTTDFYDNPDEPIWYEGPGPRFRVEWTLFDDRKLKRLILGAPGFRPAGDVDLTIDWEAVRPRMRRFHGYPYMSVGVAPRNDPEGRSRQAPPPEQSGRGSRVRSRPCVPPWRMGAHPLKTRCRPLRPAPSPPDPDAEAAAPAGGVSAGRPATVPPPGLP